MKFYEELYFISVCDVEVRDRLTDALITLAKTQTNQAFTIASESQEINGGYMNPVLLKYSTSTTCDLELTDAQFNVAFIATKLGTELSEGTADFRTSETLEVLTGNKVILNGIPSTNEVVITNEYQRQVVTITPGTVEIPIDKGFEVGTEVRVDYDVKTASFNFDIPSEAVPKNVKIILHGKARTKSNEIVRVKFIFNNCSLDLGNEFSVAADGNAETSFNASAQATNGKFGNCSIEKLSFLKDNLTEIAVTPYEVTLAPTETVTLKVNGFGDGIIKTVQVSNDEFTFESSDDSFVTVNEAGVITAVADGTATITVTNKKNAEIKDTVEVTVVTA